MQTVRDHPHTESASCWCSPVVQAMPHPNLPGIVVAVAVHNDALGAALKLMPVPIWAAQGNMP